MSDGSALSRLAEVASRQSSKANSECADAYRMIAVADIEPDPEQPRRDFSSTPTAAAAKDRLEGLAQNIQAIGILQPLRVRKSTSGKKRFILVSGERRLRAALKAGLENVPCIVERETDIEDPIQLLTRQLSENDQREPLSLYDEALAVQRMVREYRCPPAKLQELLGRSKTWVSNRLRVAERSTPAAQDGLQEGWLRHVEACRLFDLLPPDAQQQLLAHARKTKTPLSRRVLMTANEKTRAASTPAARKRGPAPAEFIHLRLRPDEVKNLIRRCGKKPAPDASRLQKQLYTILRPERPASRRRVNG